MGLRRDKKISKMFESPIVVYMITLSHIGTLEAL